MQLRVSELSILLVGSLALSACDEGAASQTEPTSRWLAAKGPASQQGSTVQRDSAGQHIVFFEGACDASGAVPLDTQRFAVADDEDSVLRVYDAERGGAPLYVVDVAEGLDLAKKKKKPPKKPKQKKKPKKSPETDIEAAALVGKRAYWITSHALTKEGKRDTRRFRFFATELPDRQGPQKPVGKPKSSLIDDMLADQRLRALGLDEASRLSPEEGGLNIEGMTATPDGKLLIGLRSPVPNRKAVLFSLENPDAVLNGEKATFSAPIQLDLGGLGVRALSSWHGAYLVIAGATSGGPGSRLYRWQGTGAPEHVKRVQFGDLNPEGFFTPEAQKQILVLSDDGAKAVQGERCKDLEDPSDKRFRGVWLDLAQP